MVISTVSDDPFAIDVAHYMGQDEDIADLIALKQFANTEFCPRFIVGDVDDYTNIGTGLAGQNVVIVSTCCGGHSRNSLAMRNMLVARAAKDNGAARVVLVEPDLSYSAQDRGPRVDHGETAFERSIRDYKKFNGQPFSALLYAQLLKTSGIDVVMTVHNHSVSVQRLFAREFGNQFHNLCPAELYCDYFVRHELNHPNHDSRGFVICAPDAGATPFAKLIYDSLQTSVSHLLLKPDIGLLVMEKTRDSERKVHIVAAADSPVSLAELCGKDVVVFDDMVRTGYTVMECCKVLKHAGARRVTFVVTHFHSSEEVKENLGHNAIDEIITTNTLPGILNRDMQGRLRKKMLVLKIEKWIAAFLQERFLGQPLHQGEQPYAIDISSKNPRWRPHDHLQS